MVERRLRKSYKNEVYFCIEKIEIQWEDCIGCDELYCRAGYEIYSNGEKTGQYRDIHFKFAMSDVIKNIKECVAVLTVNTIDKLDDFSSFEDL